MGPEQNSNAAEMRSNTGEWFRSVSIVSRCCGRYFSSGCQLEKDVKAIKFNAYGGSEVLQVVDVDEPHAGPGEVRIAVKAVGVNPSDWKRRAGLYRDFDEVLFPSGVGVEGSGLVDEVGPGVSDVSVGDAVFGFGNNAMAAQYAVLTHWARKPANLPFNVAAGLPVIAETALRALDCLGAKAGETLLVSGAAGGIGTAVIQFARLRKITVIGTGSAQKHDYLRELGAIPTTYGPGLKDRVRDLSPGGINAALDVAGSGIIPELIEIVGDPQCVVSVADFNAPQHGARFSAGPQKDPRRVLAEVARLCSEGLFRLRVERTFPLEQTAEAHDLSARGHVTGKLVIIVS
jgi:NADPH:quinone reductase-like Zn-dependent oxidoreductase